MNTAARMMQKGFSGSLQFGPEAWKMMSLDHRARAATGTNLLVLTLIYDMLMVWDYPLVN